MHTDEVGFWEPTKDEHLNICTFVNKGYGEIWEWETLNTEHRQELTRLTACGVKSQDLEMTVYHSLTGL